MAKCINCGAELKPGENFCEYCGSRIPNIQPHTPDEQAEEKPQYDWGSAQSGDTDTKITIMRGPRGDLKTVLKGYCWWMLIWSFFLLGVVVPLVRFDFYHAILFFAINFSAMILMAVIGLNFETVTLIMMLIGAYEAYIYNGMYAKLLLQKGYQPVKNKL